RARRKPKQSIIIGEKKEIVIDVLPHRGIMGGAVRPDEHLSADTLRYFVSGVNGRPFSVEQAEHWSLRSPAAMGSTVVRELLAIKGVKPRAKFDKEIGIYFWPTAFGCVELYYEHDFDHQPPTPTASGGLSIGAPLPFPWSDGRSIMDLFPPVPADPRRR